MLFKKYSKKNYECLFFRIPLASDSEDDEGSGSQAAAAASESQAEDEKEEELSQNYQDYLAGGYSPKLMRHKELDPDALVYNPADDIRRLEYARSQVLKTGVKVVYHDQQKTRSNTPF